MINFSNTENLVNLIDLEKVSLDSTLDIQKSFNKQILIFVKKFMGNVNFSTDIDSSNQTFFYLNESTSALNKSNANISMLKNLLDTLSQINPCDENLENIINSYNNTFKESINLIYANTEIIEKFIHQITITDFSDATQIITTSSVRETTVQTVSQNSIDNNHSSENTLIISEKQKKVILPYKISHIENILKNNSIYDSIDDVIDKLYTKPISYYKVSPIARFKEAYKLVKEREKGSKFKALSLAFELLGNYSLHPAIITACKSLDELDIYLACIEENALDDFKFFNIKYEVPLSISKLAKNNI
ncbi:MAG: hypothetical protein IJE68_00280 [Clostridia bacterium]|nr:hypothetical protein [Clostridia bacterium]